MADNMNTQLGPQFTIQTKEGDKFTLVAGVKSSSLFGSGGGSTGTLDVAVSLAAAIGAYKAVTYSGVLCEPTKAALSQYAGITRVAGTAGDSLKVVRSGLLTEGGWTWTANAPVFVGASGALTQTAPAVIRRIGWAISPTQISLDPFPIIGA